MLSKNDAKYLEVILDPIRVCAKYKPKFGQGAGAGLTLEQFQGLYQQDPFYSWFGLDNPLIFERNRQTLRDEIDKVLQSLLTPEAR